MRRQKHSCGESRLLYAVTRRAVAAAALGLMTLTVGWAQTAVHGAPGSSLAAPALDPAFGSDITPNAFVQTITDRALKAIAQDDAIRAGDAAAITQAVDRNILPYMNMEKTTRLATGRYWRQASAAQRQQLVAAFTGTLIRTYSSAFSQIPPDTRLTILPWRGEPDATDTVVRSTIARNSGAPVEVDYRLEKTPQGWKIYDVNVEGIWLIQNYRNQFAQEITANGIDGLIAALNRRQP